MTLHKYYTYIIFEYILFFQVRFFNDFEHNMNGLETHNHVVYTAKEYIKNVE